MGALFGVTSVARLHATKGGFLGVGLPCGTWPKSLGNDLEAVDMVVDNFVDSAKMIGVQSGHVLRRFQRLTLEVDEMLALCRGFHGDCVSRETDVAC